MWNLLFSYESMVIDNSGLSGWLWKVRFRVLEVLSQKAKGNFRQQRFLELRFTCPTPCPPWRPPTCGCRSTRSTTGPGCERSSWAPASGTFRTIARAPSRFRWPPSGRFRSGLLGASRRSGPSQIFPALTRINLEINIFTILDLMLRILWHPRPVTDFKSSWNPSCCNTPPKVCRDLGRYFRSLTNENEFTS